MVIDFVESLETTLTVEGDLDVLTTRTALDRFKSVDSTCDVGDSTSENTILITLPHLILH